MTTSTATDSRETDPARLDLTPATAARLAGVGLLVMFVLSLVAASSVQLDDLTTSPGRFRLGVASFLAVALLDVAVAWALHQVLRGARAGWSRLAAWFRLGYAAVLLAGIGLLLAALENTVGGGGGLAAGFVGGFEAVWAVGLVCFGCHLLVVGAILVRSRLAPRLLGPALMVAGAAYAADTLARILLPGYHDHEGLFTAVVAVPAMSELVLAVWLLTPAARRRLEA